LRPSQTSAHFAQLKLWHFIEKPDALHYRITEHGKHFAAGDARAPEYVYTLNGCVVDAPEDAQAPRYLFIHEIHPTSFSVPPRRSDTSIYQPKLLPT
jgi:hypothetical protein